MELQLAQIQEDLEFIKKELKEIKKGTIKMESHITFVDSIYNRVKTPFHYVMDCVNLKNKILRNTNEDPVIIPRKLE